MSERGARRGVGAPFYAPPRRKTSAEIISEARAAIYGEMSGTSSGVNGVGGGLRPLRTRRPFTPREPQRTLFTERARKKDPRPPSAFDLKQLSLCESGEDAYMSELLGAHVDALDEHSLNTIINADPRNTKKKPPLRNQRSVERSGDGWSNFPKLPHLSGHSKPLHKRNTIGQSSVEDSKAEDGLSQAISVIRPLGGTDGDDIPARTDIVVTKSLSPDTKSKRKQYASGKCVSYDASSNALGNIGVKHLAVQLPNTTPVPYENMTLLELAETISQRTNDVNRTIAQLEIMQKILERTTPGNSLRELVLRALYTHVDSEDERVLVAIARAMLTMRVTGAHLAAACKLVFKIARNDKNDHFFRNTNLLELLVEGCGRADPVSEGECCVYGAGALRVLALEPALCELARRAGALHLAALHLKILNNAKAENPRTVSEQSTHALYQLTGALRNLASGAASGATNEAREFVTSGALGELLAALQHHTDRDVLTNVARCLSVLSAQAECCAWLCSCPLAARSLLRALAACAPRPPLAVRLAYTLGNMAADHHHARLNIYNEEGGIDVLLTILESYTKRNDHETRDLESDPDLELVGTDLGGSDGSNEDVLIKTVRVIANLCLAERAGRGLASAHAERIVNALLACLQLADKTADSDLSEEQLASWSERRSELATAALATLNNITFYRDPPDPPDPLERTLDDICKATCHWLCGDSAASCEAVRALGNLSRDSRAAQLIVLEGALEHLEPFLQHEEWSVRCGAAGVLVNVCGAGVCVSRAAELAAAALAAARVTRHEHLAALLARALWNAHAHAALHPHTAHRAALALYAFIDDESVFAACESAKMGDRRASDPALFKHHVKFDIDNNNSDVNKQFALKGFGRALSVDQDLHLDSHDYSGEDLGFEEGDLEEECECGPCRRLADWEELVVVAIPLLEELKPPKADASVGTE